MPKKVKNKNNKPIVSSNIKPLFIGITFMIFSLILHFFVDKKMIWGLSELTLGRLQLLKNYILIIFFFSLIGSLLYYRRFKKLLEKPYKYFIGEEFEVFLEDINYVLHIDNHFLFVPKILIEQLSPEKYELKIEVLTGKLQIGLLILEELNAYLGLLKSEYRAIDIFEKNGWIIIILGLNFRNERISLFNEIRN